MQRSKDCLFDHLVGDREQPWRESWPLSEACIEKIAKPPEELHRESAIITAK
jgi:hypothetical protein